MRTNSARELYTHLTAYPTGSAAVYTHSPRNIMFTCILAVLGSRAGTVVRADTIVVPNVLTTVEGNTAAPNALDPRRVMQIYDASQFPSIGLPILITELVLRPSSSQQGAGAITDFNIQTSLSTTSRSPETISTSFAENIGPDYNQVAFRDAVTFTTANLPGPGNTRQFDVSVPFDEPFLYDPSAGNLLVEFQVGPPATDGQIVLDFAAGDPAVNMVVALGSPIDTTGDVLGMGFVTQFTYQPVPEPSTFALLAFGLSGVLIGRRKQVRDRRCAS